MNTPKTILILSADIGFGHRKAAQAVAAALMMQYGADVQAVIASPLGRRSSPWLFSRVQRHYDQMVIDAPWLNGLGDRLADSAIISQAARRAYSRTLSAPVREEMELCRADAIVSTHSVYLAPLVSLNRHCGRPVPLITVMTDLLMLHRQWFHQGVDHCLVPTDAAADLALRRGMRPEQVMVTGVPVNPDLADRPVCKRAARRALGLAEEPFTVLAVGSKRVSGLVGQVRALNAGELPIQLVVVAGGNEELEAELRQMAFRKPAQILGYVEDMPALMHAADCVLSKAGGLIVSESLAAGLPMLLSQATPGKETGNARYVVEGGAGDFVPTPEQTVDALERWLAAGGSLYQERARAARRLGRPEAAQRAADVIWAAVQGEVAAKAPVWEVL